MRYIKILIIIFFLVISTQSVQASTESGNSAKLVNTSNESAKEAFEKQITNCTQLLKTYLTDNGPVLAPYARTFAEEAYKNSIDCTLVAAIAGHESVYGTRIAVPYNGWGWCGGYSCAFQSWEDGIRTVSKALGDKYCKRWGACEPYSIGKYYAEDPNWPNRVSSIMRKMKATEGNSKSLALKI